MVWMTIGIENSESVVVTLSAWKRNSVTTPNCPPPPRMPQKSSGSFRSSSSCRSPSAVISVPPMTRSIVRPKERKMIPIPPDTAKPPTPVSPWSPLEITNWSASSLVATSDQRAPAWILTMPFSLSITWIWFIRERSKIIPWSFTEVADSPWPPQRTEKGNSAPCLILAA